MFITNLYSGLMVTGKGGNRVNSRDMATLASLNPGYHMDAEWVWTGLYQTIARCNGAIANIDTYDSPSNQKSNNL